MIIIFRISINQLIRSSNRQLPARETTYFCKTFELPSDQDYHIVATEPVLDNTLVIHHMILSGCKGDHVIEQDPYNCIMGNAKCSDSLGGWTVGQEGRTFGRKIDR